MRRSKRREDLGLLVLIVACKDGVFWQMGMQLSMVTVFEARIVVAIAVTKKGEEREASGSGFFLFLFLCFTSFTLTHSAFLMEPIEKENCNVINGM